jgi:hypothetical protein
MDTTHSRLRATSKKVQVGRVKDEVVGHEQEGQGGKGEGRVRWVVQVLQVRGADARVIQVTQQAGRWSSSSLVAHQGPTQSTHVQEIIRKSGTTSQLIVIVVLIVIVIVLAYFVFA